MNRGILALALASALALVLYLWLGASPNVERSIAQSTADSTNTPIPARRDPLQSASEVSNDRSAAEPASGVAAADRVETDDLRVRVVDPAGEPVEGAAVRLAPDSRALKEHRLPDGTKNTRLTTDRDGYARFAGVRSRLSLLECAAQGEPGILTLEIPFADPPSPPTLLDTAKLAEPVVVIVIPFSGTIDVHVRRVDGANAPDSSRVNLLLLRDEDLASPLPPRSAMNWSAETVDGIATFGCVELGRTWDVLASQPGSQIRTHVRAAGPIGSRSRVSIDVVLGSDHPVIAYRAIDERGRGLPNVELDVMRNSAMSFGFQESVRTRTDGNARFLVEVENGRGFRSEALLVGYRPDERTQLYARAAIPAELVDGLNEGGDVVLLPPPLLVVGVVQDAAGQPAAKAAVHLNAGNRHRLSFGNQEPSDASTETDESGRFKLRGMYSTQRFELWATKGDLRSAKTNVDQGTHGMVLTVSKYCTLSGRLLVDDIVEAYRISIDFIDPQHRDVRARVRERTDAGAFTLEPIPAGTYDISWSYNDTRLAERLHVDVPRDTNLGDIDVRGKFHSVELVLLGAVDASKLRGSIAWRAAGSQDKWSDRGFGGSPVHLVTTTTPIDVWVRADGYRSDVAYGVVGRREIQLAAPLHVKLALETTGPLPKPPYIFDAELAQDGVRVGTCEGSRTFTDENRVLVYDLAAPGRVRVRWHLEWRRDNGAMGGNVLQDHETEIEVRDVPEEQTFMIELDGKALAQMIANPPF
jgi:hypothetical protein